MRRRMRATGPTVAPRRCSSSRGDPKQAIYSFRNADLHTYLAAGDHALAHYSLVENQRSTAPLIDAMNALFTANPRAFMLDGLGYQPVTLGKKPRKPLVDRSEPRAALHVWTLPADAQAASPSSSATRIASW